MAIRRFYSPITTVRKAFTVNTLVNGRFIVTSDNKFLITTDNKLATTRK